ncbi:DNA binding protein, partial [Ascosphaera acerosa]
TDDVDAIYHAFLEGGARSLGNATAASAATPGVKSEPRRGQPLKVILRGTNDKADRILDLLEHGVFDALERGLLEAVQFTVLADKHAPQNVLEAYTFSFKYYQQERCLNQAVDGDLETKLASVNLNANGSCTEIRATRLSARTGIEMVVRRLITLSAFLPTLPKDRFMEIHIFHTDGCPPDYNPPGFQTAQDGEAQRPLLFPSDDNWSIERQQCGAVKTGLKIINLRCEADDELASSDGPAEVPLGLAHTSAVPRDADVGITEQCLLTTPSLMSTQQSDRSGLTQPSPTSGIVTSQLSTQTRQDVSMRRALEKMVLPPSPASDVVPTQVRATDLHSLMADYASEAQVLRPQLSQAAMVRLQRLRAEAEVQEAVRGTLLSDHRTKTSDVSCQCGWTGQGEDGEKLLRCCFCRKLQHPVCYGFLHGDDPAIPTVHCCYQCLLDAKDEAHTLRELSTLAMLRQALRVIIEKGFPNRVSEFNCNGHTIVQITDLLRKQGFLVATPGSKNKGFSSTGLPKFRIPFSTHMRARLRREVFNPLLKIEHYVRFQVSPGTLHSYQKARADLHRRSIHAVHNRG